MTLWEQFAQMVTNHTYLMTTATSAIIGATAGTLGVFTYLRRQAMLADVISHAALPGTMIAFLALSAAGLPLRHLAGLLLGAVIVGTAAVYLTRWISRLTTVRHDAAMAIVLSTTFGFGMVLMQHISQNPYPDKGGIQDYLFGNAASITRSDLHISLLISAVVLAVVVVVFKELILHTFDPDQSRLLGFRAGVLDLLLTASIVVATVIGVKTVGLVLMVAFVITPPVIARQWTGRPSSMALLSGVVGLVASLVGSYLSLAYGPLPTGPIIVIVLAVLMVVSLTLSPRARRQRRGVRKEAACSSSVSG
ncbi:zinc ABC transporter permease [Corynebacterium yudongzhengii]|uniref:Metal ABC transporter permease n=1 Tax=Corynebacterium yudongzhengii TaxID=2080740 RepID=A0A2U1T6Y3_9CORY|nr:metal ABC transporter permease [Corynebacterium yudongzhengii]AWB81328.1 zinc ABC transporter permease [Corynebacterium yudongzhengii]PWC01771.1 metal ABC transporter permease [Corynebacterium yudongzhengii]